MQDGNSRISMMAVAGAAVLAVALALVDSVHAVPTTRPANAGEYSRIVLFGDSLSDNGNGTYLLTNRTWPADPAYLK